MKGASHSPHASGPGVAPDNEDAALLEFVRRHPRLFVLTGAGCSTASGLGDYRDRHGQWKRQQPITGNTFVNDDHARRRYWARSYVGWQAFSVARPNRAHHSLVSLQRQGIARHLVTQNVDELHQKAGHSRVLDLHGVIGRVVCTGCRQPVSRAQFQLELQAMNPWLDALSAEHAPDGDANLEIDFLDAMRLPACNGCSGLMKPDVVFFGESVPRDTVELAMQQLQDADALLVAGSSLMVFSGYRFCRSAAVRKQPIVLLNNGKTRADELAALKIGGDCGQRLQTLADSLRSE